MLPWCEAQRDSHFPRQRQRDRGTRRLPCQSQHLSAMKIGAAQVIVALALAVLCCETQAETVKDGKKCPVLDCKGKNCKTKLGVSGCLECDCEKECPVLHCPPPCHPEENVPQDRCPECVCNDGGVPHPADDGQDVPCFTPMLRRTLRRLAELENQLRHVRHLVDDNELRLLRLFPALETRGGKVAAPTPHAVV